jgi:fructose-1,6-bisphosphatase/sedoheptulose 1,7-bisphosphatase-like protein
MSDNIVAQVSSVSIFAFVDKEGIVTENQKYIDEVAVVNDKQEKVIIDLSHQVQTTDERAVY